MKASEDLFSETCFNIRSSLWQLKKETDGWPLGPFGCCIEEIWLYEL
jgi:hypothetical protein